MVKIVCGKEMVLEEPIRLNLTTSYWRGRHTNTAPIFAMGGWEVIRSTTFIAAIKLFYLCLSYCTWHAPGLCFYAGHPTLVNSLSLIAHRYADGKLYVLHSAQYKHVKRWRINTTTHLKAIMLHNVDTSCLMCIKC